ncbi:hypothetical protein [Nodosilinea nodulosa]|uniref:hypothetical protein n=1 Tax=Nodosilinea nodulosa TaxID=416001 RepID=UPI0002E1BD20|nr:hypothetical protein [Nodosilinea nodulosa]
MNPKFLAAIATGSMLLMIGCSAPANLQGKAASAHNKMASQPGSATHDTAKSMAKPLAAEKPETVNTIDVQLSNSKLMLDHDRVDAGLISLDIRNSSGGPLDVVLLKTDLPTNQIPIKEGKVDTANAAVKQVGQLINSPMPANGNEAIIHTLEPGNYVLMAYQPGKADRAMTHTIIVQAAGI